MMKEEEDSGAEGSVAGRSVMIIGLDFGYSKRLMAGIEPDGIKSFVYFLPHGWYLIVPIQSRSPFQSGIYVLWLLSVM
jgi:hypothetical protein